MNDDYWFSPAKLKKLGRDCELAGPETLVGNGDFSSYAKANRGGGLNKSGIENHNLVKPNFRVRMYFELLDRNAFLRVADLGCGLGFTCAALAEIFCPESVTGYEVSLDAVQYCEKHWPKIKFIADAIIENDRLSEEYDLIIAQEFYPFTRTSDIDVHMGYINTILHSTVKGGVALIGFAESTDNSILNNAEEIEPALKNLDVTMSLHYLPFDKVFGLVQNYKLALFFSKLIHFATRKRRFCVLKLQRS